MPYSNPIVGGTALVRAAINSPNYAAGSLGWSINRNGSAEFNSAVIRGELDIGVSPNPRLSITSTIPAVLVTWGAANSVTISEIMVLWWNATDFKWWATGTFSGLNCVFVGTYDTTNGVYVLERTLDTGAGAIETRFGSYSLNAFQELWTTQRIKLQVGDGSLTGDLLVANCDEWVLGNVVKLTAVNTPETWHAMTLLGGFANRGAGFAAASYRLVPSPANTLQIVGQVTSGGAIGTVMATLPAGYRPITEQPFWAHNNTSNAALLGVIETTGNIQFFSGALAAGNVVQFAGLIPLDL